MEMLCFAHVVGVVMLFNSGCLHVVDVVPVVEFCR